MGDNIINKDEMAKTGKQYAYLEKKSLNKHICVELVPRVYYNVIVDRKGDSLLC